MAAADVASLSGKVTATGVVKLADADVATVAAAELDVTISPAPVFELSFVPAEASVIAGGMTEVNLVLTDAGLLDSGYADRVVVTLTTETVTVVGTEAEAVSDGVVSVTLTEADPSTTLTIMAAADVASLSGKVTATGVVKLADADVATVAAAELDVTISPAPVFELSFVPAEASVIAGGMTEVNLVLTDAGLLDSGYADRVVVTLTTETVTVVGTEAEAVSDGVVSVTLTEADPSTTLTIMAAADVASLSGKVTATGVVKLADADVATVAAAELDVTISPAPVFELSFVPAEASVIAGGMTEVNLVLTDAGLLDSGYADRVVVTLTTETVTVVGTEAEAVSDGVVSVTLTRDDPSTTLTIMAAADVASLSGKVTATGVVKLADADVATVAAAELDVTISPAPVFELSFVPAEASVIAGGMTEVNLVLTDAGLLDSGYADRVVVTLTTETVTVVGTEAEAVSDGVVSVTLTEADPSTTLTIMAAADVASLSGKVTATGVVKLADADVATVAAAELDVTISPAPVFELSFVPAEASVIAGGMTEVNLVLTDAGLLDSGYADRVVVTLTTETVTVVGTEAEAVSDGVVSVTLTEADPSTTLTIMAAADVASLSGKVTATGVVKLADADVATVAAAELDVTISPAPVFELSFVPAEASVIAGGMTEVNLVLTDAGLLDSGYADRVVVTLTTETVTVVGTEAEAVSDGVVSVTLTEADPSTTLTIMAAADVASLSGKVTATGVVKLADADVATVAAAELDVTISPAPPPVFELSFVPAEASVIAGGMTEVNLVLTDAGLLDSGYADRVVVTLTTETVTVVGTEAEAVSDGVVSVTLTEADPSTTLTIMAAADVASLSGKVTATGVVKLADADVATVAAAELDVTISPAPVFELSFVPAEASVIAGGMTEVNLVLTDAGLLDSGYADRVVVTLTTETVTVVGTEAEAVSDGVVSVTLTEADPSTTLTIMAAADVASLSGKVTATGVVKLADADVATVAAAELDVTISPAPVFELSFVPAEASVIAGGMTEVNLVLTDAGLLDSGYADRVVVTLTTETVTVVGTEAEAVSDGVVSVTLTEADPSTTLTIMAAADVASLSGKVTATGVVKLADADVATVAAAELDVTISPAPVFELSFVPAEASVIAGGMTEVNLVLTDAGLLDSGYADRVVVTLTTETVTVVGTEAEAVSDGVVSVTLTEG